MVSSVEVFWEFPLIKIIFFAALHNPLNRKSVLSIGENDIAAELLNISAGWYNKDDGEIKVILKNISMRIKKGKLTAIIGPVGCGKVTTLYCL